MKVPFLDLKQPAKAAAAAQRVFDNGCYIGGSELAVFEKDFAAYCNTQHCVGVANGTDALELVLRAVGVKNGDEVLTVANAGMYATTAIRAVGGIPVWADIDEATLLLSPESLRAVIRPPARALIVTHLYGIMAPMPELLEVAQAARITVIEDCAQAHGALLNGKRAGCWGSAACFSFYPTKNLGACGDAGAVVTSDPMIDHRLRALRQYGWTTRFQAEFSGGRNSRMDEIQGAILSAKLPYLDDWNEHRRKIANWYSEAFRRCTVIRVKPVYECDSVAHLYVLRSSQRDHLRSYLLQQGISTDIHYPIPDHLQRAQLGLPCRYASLSTTERLAGEILSLPCYSGMPDQHVEWVIRAVLEWSRISLVSD